MDHDLARHVADALIARLRSDGEEAARRAARMAQLVARSDALRAEAEAELGRIAAQRAERSQRDRARLVRDAAG